MNRQEKIELIEFIKKAIQNSQASFFVKYKGLDVENVMSLRQKLRKQGSTFKVAKVTLIRRAISEVPEVKGLQDYLNDQIALVFSQTEAPVIAKLLYEFSKENQALQIKGGYFESRILSEKAVKELATLPSREELLAQVCGVIQAPASQLVATVKGVMAQLIWVLDEVQKKKS